jgi:Na+/H+ antiporter NhaD/arsenite permease-like protein
MLIFRVIVAGAALAFVAARPRSWASAFGAAACAVAVLPLGAGAAGSALGAAGPPIAFLTAVMGLALLADRSGLAARLASLLAAWGRGSTTALFAWVCVACALLTAALSLDGAVVVMLPVIVALARSHGAPLRPLLLGTVGVANCFSAALPAGNPTNLVVMERLGLSPGGFAARMLLPSLGATLACVAVLWLLERRGLARGYRPDGGELEPSKGARLALAALGAAAVADWASPLLGLSPWLPVSIVAVVALGAYRQRPLIALPLRTGLQIASLLVVLASLRSGLDLQPVSLDGLLGLGAVAAVVTLGAALANNLPASAAVASLVAAGPGSYAALLGLSAGALATPHGSVATLVSLELAPDAGGRRLAASWALAAVAAVATGAVLLWLTSS